MAGFLESSSQGEENAPPPILMLTAAMLNVFRSSNTLSRPLIISETKERTQGARLGEQKSGSSKRLNTCIAMISASLATPLETVLLPAAIPATCVPWSQLLTVGKGQLTPAPSPTCSSIPLGQSVVIAEG